jgi:hypothetical protein
MWDRLESVKNNFMTFFTDVQELAVYRATLLLGQHGRFSCAPFEKGNGNINSPHCHVMAVS